MSYKKRFVGWGCWGTEASHCPYIRMWMKMLWLLLATTYSHDDSVALMGEVLCMDLVGTVKLMKPAISSEARFLG